MRKVEIHLNEQFHSAVGGFPNREVDTAIGFLVAWGIYSDRHGAEGNIVTIYGSREGDLHATYRNKKDEVTYSMSKIRRENGSYSTHS